MEISEASFENGRLRLTVNPREALEFIRCFSPGEYSIQKLKPKRTLTVNSYFHSLANKIAAATHADNETVKETLVHRYGALVQDGDHPFAAMLPFSTDPRILSEIGYPKCYKTREMDGKQYKCYLIYKRTSQMDASEFARLLDGTISEAEELGIDTLTQEKRSLLAYE